MKHVITAAMAAFSTVPAPSIAQTIEENLGAALADLLLPDQGLGEYLGITARTAKALSLTSACYRSEEHNDAFMDALYKIGPRETVGGLRIEDFLAEIELYPVRDLVATKEAEAFSAARIDIKTFCAQLDDIGRAYVAFYAHGMASSPEEVADRVTHTMLKNDVGALNALPVHPSIPSFELSVAAWRDAGLTVPSWQKTAPPDLNDPCVAARLRLETSGALFVEEKLAAAGCDVAASGKASTAQTTSGAEPAPGVDTHASLAPWAGGREEESCVASVRSPEGAVFGATFGEGSFEFFLSDLVQTDAPARLALMLDGGSPIDLGESVGAWAAFPMTTALTEQIMEAKEPIVVSSVTSDGSWRPIARFSSVGSTKSILKMFECAESMFVDGHAPDQFLRWREDMINPRRRG